MTNKNNISPAAYKSLSDYRRSQIKQDLNSLSKDGDLTSASNVTTYKTAQSTTTAVGSQWRGGSGEALRQIPEVYSPLWLNSNLNLPRDRATINAWCRSFYALNPIVQNAINLHSTYPISKLNIKCPNKKVADFFNEMIENIDLMNICTQIAQEYWLLGEAVVYAELNPNERAWSRLVIQNPDYVVMKPSIIANEPVIMMRPDENLRRIINSNKPSDIEQRKKLNPSIIEYVRKGQNIPLDNFHVSHIARRISPYEQRGTGLPVSVFRDLMLYDQIRECQFVQAQDLVNPIRIWKVGSADYKPTPGDLDVWRSAIEESTYDKNFKLITHDGVTVETIGAGQGIYDTSPIVERIIKNVYIGLMVPSIVMDGGGDITYANGGISLDVLRQRYMQFRNKMASWIKNKLFQPISKLNEFYDYVDGKEVLIVPDIDWNHMSLFDASDYIQFLLQVSTGEKPIVSTQTLYRSLGLDWEEERRKLKKQDIAEAIRNKEKQVLEQMPLNDLRSLDSNDEIPEIVAPAIANESPYDASGAPAGSGEGGMSGGLPGLETLPGAPSAPPISAPTASPGPTTAPAKPAP